MLDRSISTSEIIEGVKVIYGITSPNEQLDDEDIRKVVNAAARRICHQYEYIEFEEVDYREAVISNMLFLAMMEFPEFYKRYKLAQFN